MAARRVRNVLKPYAREFKSGERWWWVAVPGVGRRALGLREAEASYDEAHRAACERYAQGALGAGAPGAPAEAPISDLVDAYLEEQGPRWKPRSLAGYKLLLAAFEEAMLERKITRISRITSDVWSSYLAARQADVGNATVNRGLMAVRTMVRWGRARDPALLPQPVYLEGVKPLKELKRAAAPIIPSPLEWTKVVGQLAKGVLEVHHPQAERYAELARRNNRGIALFVAVAVQTGMRVDELRHLRAEDIGADEVRVAAWGKFSPKSHRERRIPLPPSTVKHARELVAWRDTAKGLNGTRLALGEGWLNKRLDAAWKALSGEGDAPRMHDARRTFATEISRSGQPITLVRDRLGHADVETTERYLGRYRSDADRVVPDLGIGSAL